MSFLFLVAAAACGDAPGDKWLVDRPRVLGARVEATRTTWLVAGVSGDVGFAFAGCPAPPGNLAAPRCEGALVTSGSGSSSTGELVTMETGPLAEDTLLLAAFCPNGAAATLEPRAFTATCSSGAEALLASVETGRDDNRVPVLPDEAISVEGTCGGAFVVRLDDSMRDPGETLLLAHFVTAGELDRTYSTLEPNEAAPKEVRVPWTAPADARDVKVYFVLRDGRGGTAFAMKTICKKDG